MKLSSYSHPLARLFAIGAPLAALAIACSTQGSEATGSSESAITTCKAGYHAVCSPGCGPPDCAKEIPGTCTCVANPPPPPPAPTETCTETAASGAAISFTATNDGLTLSGTSTTTAGAVTTSWTVTSGSTTWLSLTLETAGAVQTSQVSYGAPFTGITTSIFTTNGTAETGSINGRAIVPQKSTIATQLKFQDGQPAPTPTATSGTQTQLYALLDSAAASAATACAGAGKSADGGAPLAVQNFITSLWHAPLPGTTTSDVAPFASSSARSGAPGVAPVNAAELRAAGARIHTEGSVPVTGAPGSGGGVQVAYANYQNTPVDWITPGCIACNEACAESPLNWFTGWGLVACEGECWIPGQGCDEVACAIGKSCDTGQECCGSGSPGTAGGCCPSGSVCGNQDYGWCCPASAPVACVDQTGGGCFPAGTTCCAQTGGTTHCGPGDVCVNNGADCCPAGDVYAGGGCCPANEVYGPGLCCAEPTCGGVCCTGGTCVNNECQMPNLSGGICNPTPYTPVPASNTSVESSWVGTWMDTTAAVTVTIGADAKAGFDVQTSEAQSACGGGAEPAITSSAAGAGDGAIANMSSWLATIATACVASPPTLPTSEPFQLSEYKTIQLGSGGNTIYLTLYSYSCVGSSTPQYVVRYTRVGSVGQVYSDYMLNLQAKLQ